MKEEKKSIKKQVVIENNEVLEQTECNNSEPTANAIGPGFIGIAVS